MTHHLIASSSSPLRRFIRHIAHPMRVKITRPTATLMPTMAPIEILDPPDEALLVAAAADVEFTAASEAV